MDLTHSLSPRLIYPATASQKKADLKLKKQFSFRARRKQKRLKSQLNRREYMRFYLQSILSIPYKNNVHNFFYMKPQNDHMTQQKTMFSHYHG